MLRSNQLSYITEPQIIANSCNYSAWTSKYGLIGREGRKNYAKDAK